MRTILLTPQPDGTEVTTLRDKGRGQITLRLRDRIVVGAMGSEPDRFVGLTLARARRLARYGGRP